MSTQEKRNNFTAFEVTDEVVAEYLRANPDFFERNGELLIRLRLPHESGNAVSLVERQVKILRDQNEQLKTKLMDLVNVARDNDRLTERMMRLTLNLIEAESLDQLIQALSDTLFSEFQADSISILLFENDRLPEGLPQQIRIRREDPALSIFDNFFRLDRPLCGRLRSEQMKFLFGDSIDRVKSAVLVPLGRHSEFGMLAIGSEDGERFHPGMGTLFLKQLGTLISSLLRRHLA